MGMVILSCKVYIYLSFQSGPDPHLRGYYRCTSTSRAARYQIRDGDGGDGRDRGWVRACHRGEAIFNL